MPLTASSSCLVHNKWAIDPCERLNEVNEGLYLKNKCSLLLEVLKCLINKLKTHQSLFLLTRK